MLTGEALVEDKDVVVAILGVSAGLAGLVLVFLGLVVTTYQSYAGDTPKKVLRRHRRAAGLLFAAFISGVACVALASGWLVARGSSGSLYKAVIAVFAVQLVLLLGATAWSALRLMEE